MEILLAGWVTQVNGRTIFSHRARGIFKNI